MCSPGGTAALAGDDAQDHGERSDRDERDRDDFVPERPHICAGEPGMERHQQQGGVASTGGHDDRHGLNPGGRTVLGAGVEKVVMLSGGRREAALALARRGQCPRTETNDGTVAGRIERVFDFQSPGLAVVPCPQTAMSPPISASAPQAPSPPPPRSPPPVQPARARERVLRGCFQRQNQRRTG